jgi:hypothetical protein
MSGVPSEEKPMLALRTVRPFCRAARNGSLVPAGEYVVLRLDPIPGHFAHAFVAKLPGYPQWISGRCYPCDSNPQRVRASDLMVWETEKVAFEDHEDRVAGEVW